MVIVLFSPLHYAKEENIIQKVIEWEERKRMIVTTALKHDSALIDKGIQISKELNAFFIPRQKLSLVELQEKLKDDILIVGKEKIHYYRLHATEPLFFHPNIAMVRLKRLWNGEKDPFVEACQLEEGKTILDCTMGLAADSIVASSIIGGKGKIVGVEGNQMIYYLVKRGLREWQTNITALKQIMSRIEVLFGDHLQVLRQLEDNSFDVVYFDPMFEDNVPGSIGISPLKVNAVYEPLKKETMMEALRVAKDRVVLKDHFRSQRFQQFGFYVTKRPSSTFHFGVLKKRESSYSSL